MNPTREPAIETPRTDDGALLQRFLERRDDSAFAEIVARHGPMVFGVCLRLLGRVPDAEDAFQVSFLRLARHAKRLAGEPDLGAWLHTVARRAGLTALRGRRRRRWVFWERTPEPADRPEVEVVVDLDAALGMLSDAERAAVVACHLEGLTRVEAAQALAIPEGTLSTRLHRALEKLRRKLGKPPLAVLAAAAVVILPDALPAASVGLVRHLRDGTLDDWASPRVMDLYRKVTPMRLLDRFGPVAAALAAAVLVMLGAAAGYRLAAQPPEGASAGKKSFAAAVDEAQRGDRRQVDDAGAVEIVVAGLVQQGGPMAEVYAAWDIKISEVIRGERVEHRTSDWSALSPLLKQITKSGPRRIGVTIGPGPATRLDANQLVNDCKRAGFTTVDYRGPALFLGTREDSWNASVEEGDKVHCKIELARSNDFLPDWTNGWIVADDRFGRVEGTLKAATPGLYKAFALSGGKSGPAVELIESLEKGGRPDDLPAAPALPSELAKQIGAQLQHDRGTQTTIELAKFNNRSQATIVQRFPRGEVKTHAYGPSCFAPLTERVAREAGGRIDLLVGRPNSDQAQAVREAVDPLHVNAILNAARRAGLQEVSYSGQRIFTESEGPYEFASQSGHPDSLPLVKIILVLRDLVDDLPEESSGWATILDRWRMFVVKSNERERFLETLRSVSLGATPDGEIARLIKLPSEELEREIAKKPKLLQSRFRKAVDGAKKKAPKPAGSSRALQQIDEELGRIKEELAYWKWRLPPRSYEHSTHVQYMSSRRDLLEEQRRDMKARDAKM